MKTNPDLVVAVDSARARLFRVGEPTPRGIPRLDEVSSLVRPDARIKSSEQYSDSMPRSGFGGESYQTYDDHRERHDLEERRRFAGDVAGKLREQRPSPGAVVVLVTHAMRAALERELAALSKNGHWEWRNGEFTQLDPSQLASLLVEQGQLRRTSPEP